MSELRVRMFAGPNGSGKSTLKDELKQEWLGVYVNADEIEKTLKSNSYIDFSEFQLSLDGEEIFSFFKKSAFSDVVKLVDPSLNLRCAGSKLYFNGVNINSYHASALADYLRRKLVEQKISFSFETVMSHPDKIEFLKFARTHGFRTYLYFVATEHPDINVERVQIRVASGGHPVPEDKIRKRYQESIILLFAALEQSDRAYVFDNSGTTKAFIAEITNGEELKFMVNEIPHWFDEAVVKKFN
ncbi:MAG TPA: zeta toxin family protein [Cellvibrio sp.]|nr:zeta toxin family protein [Cellvibrio sp.]